MSIKNALERAQAGPDQGEWGRLLAKAQMSLVAEPPHPDDAGTAASLLELAARETGLGNPEHRRTAAILAACANALAGRPGRAQSVIREQGIMSASLTLGEMTAIAIASPQDTRESLERLPGPGQPGENCRQAVLAHQEERRGDRNIMLTLAASQTPDSWSSYLLGMMRNSPCGQDSPEAGEMSSRNFSP